jgi:RNA polymerase sigma-70 factor (ECF subfamily)
MSRTSLTLLEQLCRPGGPAAWERLVDLYGPLLRRWARRYDVQDSDADDLVQEVLLAVVRDLPKFKHNGRPGAFRAWLRQMLVHRLRDFWRSRQYRPEATGRTDFVERLTELADDHSAASRLFDREHDEHVMNRLLRSVEGRFDPKTWRAFRRQVVDGRRADAVAAELGLSLSSVYVAKSRVLNALRQEAENLIDPDA